MSNVAEIIAAVTRLPAADQWDLYQWLNESPDIMKRRLDALRQEVGTGLAQADRGELALLNMEAVKDELRQRLASGQGR